MQRNAFAHPTGSQGPRDSARASFDFGPRGRILGRALALAALLGLTALQGCGGSSTSVESAGSVGEVVDQPDPSIGSQRFVVDENNGGEGQSLKIKRLYWGRMVNVRDVTGELQHRNYVVGEDISSNNDYVVATNPVTEETTVTIRHAFGTPAYDTAFVRLDQNVILIGDKSLNPNELPPFPLIPRNAAIVIQFDDLLDPATINSQTVKVLRGYPPVTPFDARIIPDINHGDLANFDGVGGSEFYTTRIIIDPTVSQVEAATSNPPLPVNSLGLPASLTQSQPNIALRIPTKKNLASGQVAILTNPTDHALSTSGNGTIDMTTPTHDIVRALRSGGTVTNDVNNGFLVDPFRPSLVAQQAVVVGQVDPTGTDEVFKTSVNFAFSTCASGLRAGDVIQQTGVFAEVVCAPGINCGTTDIATGNPLGSLVADVYVRVISPVGGSLAPNQIAQVSMRYDSVIHQGKEECFLRFTQVVTPPATGVSPTGTVTVRFSEPMDPTSLQPFDTFTVTRKPALDPTLSARDFIVGAVGVSSDLREFSFQPTLPLKHTSGTAEAYFVNLVSGAAGATDLAGNPLDQVLPEFDFTLLPSAATQNTAGLALRFNTADEIGTNGPDGFPELRGQFLLDFENSTIRPRPVSRFSAVADRSQPVPGNMQPFGPGVQTPLSKLGSKLQALWRYCDVGFALQDEQNYNVDIEGSSWAPVGGSIVADTYTRFEMGMSHGEWLPDEVVDPTSLLPVFPFSGLVVTYSQNLLDPVEDPQRLMHPGQNGLPGYNLQPAEAFQSTTGTIMMPWPLNRGIPLSQYTFYTWRDTAILAKGGGSSSGADPQIVSVVAGIPHVGTYTAGNVPSIGLPILNEYRCYPDNGALGLNAFDISLATAASSRPNFRAFSTGGVNVSNLPVIKNPDNEPNATGGFNPTSTPPGAVTFGADCSFYIGQLDIVVRISRAHSIWFDVAPTPPLPTLGFPIYSTPVIEPRATDQPEGTQVVLAFRGATSATGTLAQDANTLDAYGNGTAAPSFFNGDATWKSNLSQIQGAKFFQVRITFISNAETNLTAELSALGFAYRLQ